MPAKLQTSEISLKTAHEFAFSPDSKRVAFIGGRDLTVFDIETRKAIFAVHPIANPSHIDFSPDGNCLALKNTRGRTIILDASAGKLICDFNNQKEGEGDEVIFTACSKFVASVAWDTLFTVRDCKTSQIIFSEIHSGCHLHRLSANAERNLFVYSVCPVPDNPTGYTPCKIALRRWPSNAAKAEFLPKEWKGIWGLKVSPSGRFLAVVVLTKPYMLEIYDMVRLETVAECPWNGSPGCAIAWSNDEKTIVVNDDECFRMYSLPELKLIHELPTKYPCFAKFSPCGDFIGLGSWEKSFIVRTDSLADFESRKKQIASRAAKSK